MESCHMYTKNEVLTQYYSYTDQTTMEY